MRQNIREKSKNLKINYTDEMLRIENLFSITKSIIYFRQTDYLHQFPQYTTIENIFEGGLYLKYPYAENFISLSDARISLGISKDNIKQNDISVMLDYFEFIFNVIQFFITQFNSGMLNIQIIDTEFVNKISNNIKIVLDKINYKFEKEDGYFYIVEKDADATAVAEIYNDISGKVIEYRRYNLKGNIERKCEILNTLANKFEAIRPDLKANNFSEIEDKTGCMLNNLDIRHNNTSGKNEKEIIIKMSDEELEQWYDRTFDLLLMCFMYHHYLDFRDDIKDLNQKLKK